MIGPHRCVRSEAGARRARMVGIQLGLSAALATVRVHRMVGLCSSVGRITVGPTRLHALAIYALTEVFQHRGIGKTSFLSFSYCMHRTMISIADRCLDTDRRCRIFVVR